MKWVSYTRSISSRIGEENPSNTIAEQNERIARYLKKCGCSVSEKYSDRRRTAEATEGFDKLVQDGMARKFDAVVVDSIFRCGRTLPFAIEALQRTFYPLGIQFAVVEDDFCSADKTAEEVAEYFNGKTIDKIRSEFITNRQNHFEEGTLTHTTSVRTLPEDKWIIAENAHEAIVTKDEYYQAQKAIRNVTPIQYKVGDDFALKGKICCGNCNRQLRHERQYGEMVFYCGYKRSAGKFSKCYGVYYREHSVNAKVARAIKTVFYALDVVNQGMQEKQSITVRCMDIEDLEKQAEAIRVEQIKLYESYADGVLLRDAYIEKKKALSEKLAALQDSIRTEKEEQECADELDEEIRALTKQASEKTYIGGLTKECVDAFVSMVYLYDDQTMKIEFNCEDVIRRALEKYGA